MRRARGSLPIRRACALAVMSVAALTGAQDLFDSDLGIDQWIARVPDNGVALVPGRMALAMGACFVLTGAALLALDRRTRVRASDVLGVIVAAVGTLALLVGLGWLVLRGEEAGLYDSRFGVAILIAGGIGLLAAATLLIAVYQRAAALDRQRARSRQAAQMALREREEHYRDLYENSPDLYAWVSVETQEVLDCNQTLLAALGYPKHEIIGSNVEVLYHSDHREAKGAARREFFATGEVHDAELALRRRDGSKLDVSLNVTSLRDADGRIVSARVVWRDISARKQADRDRRFLTEFSDLLRSATDPHEAMARVAERLAQHLKVARCLFAEVDPEAT